MKQCIRSHARQHTDHGLHQEHTRAGLDISRVNRARRPGELPALSDLSARIYRRPNAHPDWRYPEGNCPSLDSGANIPAFAKMALAGAN
jgi:hypothetical protein